MVQPESCVTSGQKNKICKLIEFLYVSNVKTTFSMTI